MPQYEIDESDDATDTATTTEDAAPAAIEEPRALALNLPRGAAWLMDQAAMLDTEADRYGENHSYGSPQQNIIQHIRAAANTLRAVVGHALLVQSQDITPR